MPITDPEARRAYYRKYAKENPEGYRRRNKAAKKRFRAEFDALKNHPCMDCGGSFPPYVMDWDHRDPTGKAGGIGTMITNCVARSRILDEIAKCDLLCANCHRIRTHGGMTEWIR